jgi:hypothetical protein
MLTHSEEHVMAEKKTEKCAHPGCNCPAAKESKYCSDYCESIGKQPSIACSCGHAACAAQKSEAFVG